MDVADPKMVRRAVVRVVDRVTAVGAKAVTRCKKGVTVNNIPNNKHKTNEEERNEEMLIKGLWIEGGGGVVAVRC